MFGFEDNLLLKLAGVFHLTANYMQERYRPAHVRPRETITLTPLLVLTILGHRCRAGFGDHAL